MRQGFALLRAVLFTMALAAFLHAGAPALAQQGHDVPPAPMDPALMQGANPTASVPNEAQLLQQLRKIEGRVTIPDGKAALLHQPQGRDYRQFREGALPWIGAIAILGMILALVIFYFTRGRIVLEHSPESGIKIKRFSAFERFTHWLTGTAFIVLSITGLNYIFGKRLLMPLIGPYAFATWSQWAKYVHNFVSWAFMLGIVFMFVVWIRDNIPDRYDYYWLKRAGGVFSGTHPPARRFNAGQKLIFWSVILGGLALSVSGIILLFPISAVDVNAIQWAQYVHATIGVLLTAIIIAHIYIGTLGMEGAYDAMSTGDVDLAWARAHHSLWVEEEQARTSRGPQLGDRPAPAE